MRTTLPGSGELDLQAVTFYQQSLDVLKRADIPFLLGGAYALERYTSIQRHTKDFDFFIHSQDVRRALEELFRRYRRPAYRVAYRLLGNGPDALDAVQEGFVKALTNLAGFQGRSSFKTWLLRVVSNAALDLGRQRGRREAPSLEAAQAGAAADQHLQTPDQSGRGLERADLRSLLDRALATLSEGRRQTFVL